jgi:hypothetical protein
VKDSALIASIKPVCRSGFNSLLNFYGSNTDARGTGSPGYANPTINLDFHHFLLLHNLKKERPQRAWESKAAPTAVTYEQVLSNCS